MWGKNALVTIISASARSRYSLVIPIGSKKIPYRAYLILFSSFGNEIMSVMSVSFYFCAAICIHV